MKFNIIQDGFRHYKKMYAIMQKFDKPMNSVTQYLCAYTFYFFNLLRLHNIISIFIKRNHNIEDNQDFVGFVFSKNQISVLESLRSYNIEFPAVFIGGLKPENNKDIYISNKKLFLEALAFPKLGKLLLKSFKDPILKKNFIRVFKLIGCINIYEFYIEKTSSIINFNDHVPYSVLLCDMAKGNNVKTVYIQHAPVSEKFPALYHDYNILFSADSRDKYNQLSYVNVDVLFDPRFSLIDHTKWLSKPKNNTVLICTNLLDEVERVLVLIRELQEEYIVTLRSHPRDNRKEWKQASCTISHGTSIWKDIEKNNIIITNESAVVLEAIYCNRDVYKAAFFSESIDNYGYLEKKLLTKEHYGVDSLMNSIKNKSIEYDKEKLVYFTGNMLECEKRVKEVFYKIKEEKFNENI